MEALASQGLERSIVAVVPSFQAVLTVAQASDLIGLVPASFLADPAHRWLRQLVLAACRSRVGGGRD